MHQYTRWSLAAVAVLFAGAAFALPPTAPYEERMARIGSSSKTPFIPDALAEFPDSPELLELSSRLHALHERVKQLPDAEATVLATHWLPAFAMQPGAPPPGGSSSSTLPDDPGLVRYHQGTVRESVRRLSGLFESSQVDEFNINDQVKPLVRLNEVVAGKKHRASFQHGGTDSPLVTAASKPQESTIPRIGINHFAAGPVITLESFLLNAIRDAHGDRHAEFDLKSLTVTTSQPTPSVTRYALKVETIGKHKLSYDYEFDFDQAAGGNLVRFSRARWYGALATPLLQGVEETTVAYTRISQLPEDIWLPAQYKYTLTGFRARKVP